MPDREKVIKGIQECDLNGGLIGNCPYKEIVLLLKEQEGVHMTEAEKAEALELAKHAIGMDNGAIYRTHGERVFIPFRNYFATAHPEATWEAMVREGYAECEIHSDGSCEYRVTPNGIYWMVHQLRVSIAIRW